VTAPSGSGFLHGLSAAFSVGARHALERGAVFQDVVALHVQLRHPGVSTQVTALRRALLGDVISAFAEVRTGTMPLVVHVDSADVMATLLTLKAEAEAASGKTLRVTFTGAAEAHLLAHEIGEAGVSVILSPSRPFPGSWDQRRILPGPPLSNSTAFAILLDHGVNVALGVVDESSARNTRFDIAWAALESQGRINKAAALSLVTTSLEKALGLGTNGDGDVVAYRGGDLFSLDSKVVAVISSARRMVDLF